MRTQADLEAANGLSAEADKTVEKALNHPTAGPIDLHQYGRQLLARGDKDKALKVFELNARRHPNQWPVHVGLARGYAAVGRNQDALTHARLALAQAPDDVNRQSRAEMVEELSAAKPGK